MAIAENKSRFQIAMYKEVVELLNKISEEQGTTKSNILQDAFLMVYSDRIMNSKKGE